MEGESWEEEGAAFVERSSDGGAVIMWGEEECVAELGREMDEVMTEEG